MVGRITAHYDIAMPFTTGTNGSGYRLTSISLDFLRGRSRTHEPVYVYLQEDDGNGRPNHSNGGQVATLTKNGLNFEAPVTGVNKYTVREYTGRPQTAGSVHLGVVATRTVEAKRSNEGGSQRPML